jgi:YbbR domain-containing protein
MFQNKNANLVLSIIIALVMWGYVLIDVNPTVEQRFENIPIKIQNQETLIQRGLALNHENYTITVVVSGKRSDIVKLSQDHIVAIMDVYGYALGTNYIPVKIEVPDDLSLSSNANPKLEVVIEEYVVSNRAVEVHYVGELPANTEPANLNISPRQVEVRGPKSKVESVARLFAEVPLEEWTATGSSTVNIQPLDDNGVIVTDITLSASTITVTGNLLSLKTVPLEIVTEGIIPEEYKVESMDIPTKITLVGPEETLKEIESITSLVVDISGITTTTVIPVPLTLPQGVSISANAPVPQISIKISGMDTKTVDISTSEILFENLSQEYSAYVNTSSLRITMTGDQKVLESVEDPTDFRLSVDLAGLTPGVYTLPVMVKYDMVLNSFTISPIEVQVTINALNEAF